MKHGKNIDEVLKRGLRSASKDPREQMAAVGERVLQSLLSKDAVARETSATARSAPVAVFPWLRLAMVGTTAAILAVVIGTAWLRTPKFAVVEGVEGTVSRLEPGQTVRTGESAGSVIQLADGSRVEVRSNSELTLERAEDGVRINLAHGGVIVNAAKQRNGHLYVDTRDVKVSVIGTVFMVSAEEQGSRVSVIEGEVHVQQGKIETKLRPGEHVSTVPNPEPRAVKEEITWSPKAEEHLALLQQSRPSTPSEPQRQRFEEAAIRPCAPENPPPGARGGGGGGGRVEVTPGRFYAPCMTVAALIEASHPLEDPLRGFTALSAGLGIAQHVRGGPEWISTDRYTVEAITNGSTDASAMTNVMLRELLERRLQLKVHIEAEQVSALALVITPGGLKIKPFQEGDCDREKKTNWPNPKPRCNQVRGDFNGPNWRWEQGSNPLGALTALGLSAALRAPVIDRTGSTDKFALILEYAIDESTPGLTGWCQQLIDRNQEPVPTCLGRSTAPSVHTVLSQVGLKVEPTKASREFIVIDRVERPSDN